jgi:uncharacterized protein
MAKPGSLKIVSNTGPIIGLAKIGQLGLLKKLAPKIFIPPFVHKELFGRIGPETIEIEGALGEFIKVSPIRNSDPTLEKVLAELDEGERQAIVLARSFEDEVLLLMDDYAGRKAARKIHLVVTGIMGLLLSAKERGLVGKITPLVEELREKGYWLSDEVIRVTRKLAKE